MPNENKKNVIYLVSGPVGVGKSTISKKLAQMVKKCVLLEGDFILHMFEYGSETSWEERLSLTWENILTLTRNLIQNDFNVVIDFVVEDELDWFCKHISDLQVTLKYIVMRADKEKLIERIRMRGDIESIERSLFLLNKLESTPSNQQFLFDTTLRNSTEIVDAIINDTGFIVEI
ncbi:ATP-binding protein [Paenibacillus thiaminolyticus]|uniref:AAA family ATPase n=1 Tax=Paenibacillus thiaminolyticus TaxID=49283 RepID=UPI001161D732|nr:AAA family ATPase [Paenibacillus thiaminolyticus]NGP58332.1 ATP-binding protein [Paenibacillus thiaminolyticus]WCR26613.1 ATP-binding protein [Paenibacillus thiaminolyticus]